MNPGGEPGALPDPAAAPAGRLLLIRHGQTGGNGNHYVGWEDVPLDPVGQAQAQALAGVLAAERLDAVYSSPLQRARATLAPLVAARGLALEVREELKEIDYGRFQGQLKTDRPLRLRHDYRHQRLPGGESLYDVYQRVARIGAEFAAALAAGRHFAVVGHFWSNRMLLAALRGVAFEAVFEDRSYKPRNASVLELTPGAAPGAGLASRWLVERDIQADPD